jgi:predicted nucleic acid-binding protein
MIVKEVVDEAKRYKREIILPSVDFNKAYDSMDWSFLDFVIERMNFPESGGSG